MVSIHHILRCNPVFLKDIMTSMLTLSNKSLKLFPWKNFFLRRAKARHSIRTCLMVQGILRIKHCSCSFFSIIECVILVWPIGNRDIKYCSLRDFLRASLHSRKVSLIRKSFGRCHYSCIVAILRGWIYWFWVSSQDMESWIFRWSDPRPTWLPSRHFHILSI